MKYYGSSHHFLDILNYASSSSSSHGEDDVTLRCKDGQSLQTSSLLIFLLKSEDNMIRRALLTHHDPMDPMDPITIHFPDFTQSTLKSLIQLLSQGITTCQSQSQIEDIIEIGHIFGIYNINLKDDDHNDIQQQIKDEIQDDNDENDDDYDDYEMLQVLIHENKDILDSDSPDPDLLHTLKNLKNSKNCKDFETLYKCPICKKFVLDGISTHVKVHHKLNLLPRKLYNDDSDDIDLKKKYYCYSCRGVFDSLSEVKSHAIDDPETHPTNRNNSHNSHNRKRPAKLIRKEDWICDICGSDLSRKSDYELHFKNIHPDIRPHKCDICEKRFKQRAHCIKHAEVVHKVKQDPSLKRSCKLCNLTFHSWIEVNEHQRQFHPRKSLKGEYPCHICKKMLTTKYSREIHVKIIHQGQRSYMCDLCGTEFNTKQNHEQHMAKHVDGSYKKFQCKICNQLFVYQIELVRHYKNDHKNDEPEYKHICTHCGAGFITMKQYSVHQKKHNDYVQLVRCKICGKSLGSNKPLRQHIIAYHSDFVPFECPECGLKNRQYIYIQRHIASAHPNAPVQNQRVLYKPSEELVEFLAKNTEKVIVNKNEKD